MAIPVQEFIGLGGFGIGDMYQSAFPVKGANLDWVITVDKDLI